MQRITANSFSTVSQVHGSFAIGIPAGAGSVAAVHETSALSEHLGMVSVKTKEQTFLSREVWLVSDDKIGSRVYLEPIEVDSRGNRMNEKPVHVFGTKKRKRATPEPVEAPEKAPETTLSKNAQSVLKVMRNETKGTKFSKVRIVTTIAISTSEWTTAINELLEAGLVEKTGKKRGTKYGLV